MPVPGRLGISPDDHSGQGLPGLVKLRQCPEVGIEKQAPGNHEERLLANEIGQGQQTSRGAPGDGLSRVMQAHPESPSITQKVLKRTRGGVDGQSDLVNPARPQQLEQVLHHRPIGHRQERLGYRPDQRHQMGVLAAGKNHRLHRRPPEEAAGRAERAAAPSVRPGAAP